MRPSGKSQTEKGDHCPFYFYLIAFYHVVAFVAEHRGPNTESPLLSRYLHDHIPENFRYTTQALIRA